MTVPQVRAAAAELAKQHPALSHSALRALVDGFLATGFHDLRSTGIALLEREGPLLRASDLPWLIGVARHTGNWAHVDWLATKVIGPVISAERPGSRARVLRKWARDEDLWVRRSALLAQHDELRAGRGDFALFETLAAPMLKEREFFIRKAIGWILREVSRKRPKLTCDFLLRHRARVSGLTLREGARHLPARARRGLAL